MTATVTPDESAVEAFREQLRGDLVQPRDPGYEEARTVWDGMVENYPSMIARCTGAADVVAAIEFAVANDVPFSVKGGGHNVAGKSMCDAGLMIDLSLMDSVSVDPRTQRAQVGPGATWGDFDHEAQAFGLVLCQSLIVG